MRGKERSGGVDQLDAVAERVVDVAAADTGQLEVLIGTALSSVTDITKRALFHEPIGFDPVHKVFYGQASGLRALKLKADTAATRAIEVAPILRQWAGTDVAKQPHAIVLALPTEGSSPVELRFASLEAAANHTRRFPGRR